MEGGEGFTLLRYKRKVEGGAAAVMILFDDHRFDMFQHVAP
jgi:hypothetical protein